MVFDWDRGEVAPRRAGTPGGSVCQVPAVSLRRSGGPGRRGREIAPEAARHPVWNFAIYLRIVGWPEACLLFSAELLPNPTPSPPGSRRRRSERGGDCRSISYWSPG